MARNQKAFTLIEFILVAGIFVLIASFGLPLGFESYRNYLVHYEARHIVSILRRAEQLSITQAHSTMYGVAFLPNSLTLFQGASYTTRNPGFDETYTRSGLITVSTTPVISEIVFAPISGIPSATTTFSISNGGNLLTVDINNYGVIDW